MQKKKRRNFREWVEEVFDSILDWLVDHVELGD